MLMKICLSCGCRIKQGEQCNCRHRNYDKTQREQVKTAFYHSKEWRLVVEAVKARANGLDEYSLLEGRLCKGNTVHHIYTIEERPDLKLTLSNLIYVSSTTHNMIHAEYDKGKANRKAIQEKLKTIRGQQTAP